MMRFHQVISKRNAKSSKDFLRINWRHTRTHAHSFTYACHPVRCSKVEIPFYCNASLYLWQSLFYGWQDYKCAPSISSATHTHTPVAQRERRMGYFTRKWKANFEIFIKFVLSERVVVVAFGATTKLLLLSEHSLALTIECFERGIAPRMW